MSKLKFKNFVLKKCNIFDRNEKDGVECCAEIMTGILQIIERCTVKLVKVAPRSETKITLSKLRDLASHFRRPKDNKQLLRSKSFANS